MSVARICPRSQFPPSRIDSKSTGTLGGHAREQNCYLRIPGLGFWSFFPAVDSCLLIPKPRLVTWPFRQVPCLDHESLRFVDITLCLHLLHSHFHSILCKHYVLGLHPLCRSVGDLLECKITMVSYENECAENDEEDDEREEFAIRLSVGS